MGLAVNAVLTGAKFAAGLVGHSHALVADAVESLADIVSSIIVWRGLVVAAEPPDEDHPYGHGKAEPLAAAIVSTMLLLAAGWIVLAALRSIAQPHPAPAPFTLLVLGAVIAIKEGLFRFVRREAATVQSTVVRTDAWHHRSHRHQRRAHRRERLRGRRRRRSDCRRRGHRLERLAAVTPGARRVNGHRPQPRGGRPSPPDRRGRPRRCPRGEMPGPEGRL
jgi:hypothetical protein